MATSRKTPAKKKAGGAKASPSKTAVQPTTKLAKKAMGRPPLWNPELAEAVCFALMQGNSLRKVCAQPGMPSVDTVMRWLHADVDGFCEQYARARELGAELFGEDTIAIADEDQAAMQVIQWRTGPGDDDKVPAMVAFDKTAIARNKLRVETRFRYAAQMAAKRWGKIGGIDPTDKDTQAGVVVFVKDLTGRKD